MKKFNPNIKDSRQFVKRNNKHSRHELTEDGKNARSIRHQRNKMIDEIAMDFDDDFEFLEIKKFLK